MCQAGMILSLAQLLRSGNIHNCTTSTTRASYRWRLGRGAYADMDDHPVASHVLRGGCSRAIGATTCRIHVQSLQHVWSID